MSRTVSHVDGGVSDRSSDLVFGIAAGLYLALLVAPLAVQFTATRLSGDMAVLYVAVLAVGVGCLALAGALFSRRPDLPVRLGRTRTAWIPALAGLAVVALSVASSHVRGSVAVTGLFLGTFAAMSGLLLGVLARSRYARAVVDRVPDAPTWTAGWPAAERRKLQRAGLLVGVLSGVGFVGGVVLGLDWLRIVGQFVLSVGLAAAAVGSDRTVTATPDGLVVGYTVYRRLLPWVAFDGYSRTSDAIVLHRPRRLDVRMATADIDDPDAVEDALTRRLLGVT